MTPEGCIFVLTSGRIPGEQFGSLYQRCPRVHFRFVCLPLLSALLCITVWSCLLYNFGWLVINKLEITGRVDLLVLPPPAQRRSRHNVCVRTFAQESQSGIFGVWRNAKRRCPRVVGTCLLRSFSFARCPFSIGGSNRSPRSIDEIWYLFSEPAPGPI